MKSDSYRVPISTECFLDPMTTLRLGLIKLFKFRLDLLETIPDTK